MRIRQDRGRNASSWATTASTTRDAAARSCAAASSAVRSGRSAHSARRSPTDPDRRDHPARQAAMHPPGIGATTARDHGSSAPRSTRRTTRPSGPSPRLLRQEADDAQRDRTVGEQHSRPGEILHRQRGRNAGPGSPVQAAGRSYTVKPDCTGSYSVEPGWSAKRSISATLVTNKSCGASTWHVARRSSTGVTAAGSLSAPLRRSGHVGISVGLVLV